VKSELGGRGRLARALQPDERQDRRPAGKVEVGGLAAEQSHQLVADDPRHLLGRRELLHHLPADRLLLDALRELLDDRKRDIGLEQRKADLPESGFQVVIGQMSFASKLLEDALDAVAQPLEHGLLPP
jgi:hypothetical protein